MPTFSTIPLENLLEPRVRDSYAKPPLSTQVAAPSPERRRSYGQTIQWREIDISISKPPVAPRHIYISPALYATPEPAPIPETASEALSPSPYIVNHKRRGGGVGLVGNWRSGGGGGGFEIPEEQGEKVRADLIEVVVEEEEEREEVVQDNFGEDEMFGIDKVKEEKKEEDEDKEEEGGNEVIRQFDCRSFVSAQGEFFDAIEDFSSDTSISNTPSNVPNLESELRALRLSLLEEIERRREAEEALSSMHNQWQRISDLLSEVGLTFPAPTNSSGSMQRNNAAIDDLSQEVIVARFVAQAIGKGQARAEAEMAAEAILESKDQEISRLRNKLQYHETVNYEMSQRNQGIIELARKQRQRRKTHRRWFWSCIGVSIAIGISAIAYSYLPGTSKHQKVSSCGDSSDGSCASTFKSA